MITEPSSEPSPGSVRAIGAVLARAACFDDRITEGDRNRIKAWAIAIDSYEFDTRDLLAAVTMHYQGSSETIRVNTLIVLARKIRRERAELEKGEEITAIAPPDPQMDGLPIGGVDGPPVWDAYDQHGAVDLPCETCGAGEREACVNPRTNSTRRIPCFSRIKAGAKR